jgi:hypothetical protein
MVATMRNLMSDVTRVVACVVAGFMVSVAMAQDAGSHRVKASLVSQESSLHTSVSNQDVYLLHVIPHSGVAFNAVAMDSYPSYARALPLGRFDKTVAFSVKLIRTPDCDRAPEQSSPSIRCFAIDRRSLKLPKDAATDLWWK